VSSSQRLLHEFYVQPYAGWKLNGAAVRRHLDRILDLLADPCLGSRLRHPPRGESEVRWDDFCKLDLPGNLRILYRWVPEVPAVLIERIGPHLGEGVRGDVYELHRLSHRLPPAHSHAHLEVRPCCDDSMAPYRSVAASRARNVLLRLARR